ncbi:ATP-binding cassette domain-containing protein [Granulosicoccus sp.]|nr:ATP-binding cassette domain-containing protein [Granulosicoccus sp.]
MTAFLQLIDVSFSYGSTRLFNHLSLTLRPGDRTGLVGHNGSGKSTLLSLITDGEALDSGEIRKPRGLRIALVEQFVPERLSSLSLAESTLDVLPLEQHETSRYRADELLQRLGFSYAQAEQPVASLSGGQQNLALLARAILSEPELLLMDEPGNHMDVLAMAQLQRFLLAERSLPFIMISHDRELLNNCCNRTVFLRDRQSHAFDLPFDTAVQALAEQDKQAAHLRNVEEKEIQRLQNSAKRLAQWGRDHDNEDLARKAKTIQKRVERLKEQQTVLSEGSVLDVKLDGNEVRAKSMLTIEKLTICTPDGKHELLDIDFQYVRPGDRIALLGVNGVGKSSTIECLMHALHGTDDSVRFNPRVKLGLYDQELREFDESAGRFDWLRERCELTDDRIKQVLLQSGVAFADFDRPVNVLSGGERARMMFMLFQLNKPNFLILDEPTNHIDIQGREQLEEQLINAEATLLITSHDRRFIERVASRWWWINDGQLHELSELDAFYDALEYKVSATSNTDARLPTDASDMLDATSGTLVPSLVKDSISEDHMLERIAELERLLTADKARKPKFQKPKLQQQWQAELDELWQLVD